jgi:uncharacterized protein (TIGR03435 family)
MRLLWCISASLLSISLAAQTPLPAKGAADGNTALPVYDVSVIRPAAKADGDRHVWTRLNTLDVGNMSLKGLLTNAFDIPDDMLVGLPDWARDMNVDIQAKTLDEDKNRLRDLTNPQRRAMMVALFQDRLGLKWHKETRVLHTDELVLAGAAPKLEPTKATGENSGTSVNDTKLRMTNVPLSDLAVVLSDKLGRPVVDKTDLPGRYDITLQWSPDQAPTSAENPDAPPALITALQEQLGLKLKPGSDPVEVFVIDQLMQPSAN